MNDETPPPPGDHRHWLGVRGDAERLRGLADALDEKAAAMRQTYDRGSGRRFHAIRHQILNRGLAEAVLNRILADTAFRRNAVGQEIVAEAGRLMARHDILDDTSGVTSRRIVRLHEQLFGWAAVWEPNPPPWPATRRVTPPAPQQVTEPKLASPTATASEPPLTVPTDFATLPVGELCPLRTHGRGIEAMLTNGYYHALPTVRNTLFSRAELSVVSALIDVYGTDAPPAFTVGNLSDAFGQAETRCPDLRRYIDRPRRAGGGSGVRQRLKYPEQPAQLAPENPENPRDSIPR